VPDTGNVWGGGGKVEKPTFQVGLVHGGNRGRKPSSGNTQKTKKTLAEELLETDCLRGTPKRKRKLTNRHPLRKKESENSEQGNQANKEGGVAPGGGQRKPSNGRELGAREKKAKYRTRQWWGGTWLGERKSRQKKKRGQRGLVGGETNGGIG